jgi:hypothetical protein
MEHGTRQGVELWPKAILHIVVMRSWNHNIYTPPVKLCWESFDGSKGFECKGLTPATWEEFLRRHTSAGNGGPQREGAGGGFPGQSRRPEGNLQNDSGIAWELDHADLLVQIELNAAGRWWPPRGYWWDYPVRNMRGRFSRSNQRSVS